MNPLITTEENLSFVRVPIGKRVTSASRDWQRQEEYKSVAQA
jgi:hypothetical protein